MSIAGHVKFQYHCFFAYHSFVHATPWHGRYTTSGRLSSTGITAQARRRNARMYFPPDLFPFHTFRTGTLPRSWCHAAAPMLACEQRGRKVSCVVVTRRLLFTARGNVREKSSRPPRPEKRNCRGTCGAEFHISNLPLIGLQNRPTRIQNRSTFACDFQGYVPTVRNEQ